MNFRVDFYFFCFVFFTNRILLIGDVEALKNSIQTRYVARIIYELFATSDSILLLEQYGLHVLDLCEKRKFIFSCFILKFNLLI